jgi:hypothetical protein
MQAGSSKDESGTRMKFFHKHRFTGYLLAFLLMLLPAVPLYLAAQNGSIVWISVLLALIVLGNLLALLLD